MNYIDIYKNLFIKKDNYNVHILDKERYDFVINEIINNDHKKIIDISSGRGFFIKYLLEKKSAVEITSTDLEKFHNYDVNFIKLDLSNKSDFLNITEKYDLLSCMDVLEHIEEKYIEDILLFFTGLSNNFCFTIANHSDIHNGVELHVTRKNKDWWDKKLNNYFTIKNSFVKYDNRLYCYVLEKKYV